MTRRVAVAKERIKEKAKKKAPSVLRRVVNACAHCGLVLVNKEIHIDCDTKVLLLEKVGTMYIFMKEKGFFPNRGRRLFLQITKKGKAVSAVLKKSAVLYKIFVTAYHRWRDKARPRETKFFIICLEEMANLLNKRKLFIQELRGT